MSVERVVIIGAGHNGLVAAARLAKAGLQPLVVERRPVLGGCAITDEIAPGFRCSTLAHTAHLSPAVISELGLASHGLELIDDVPLFAPSGDGRSLFLSRHSSATTTSIAQFSPRDAEAYGRFYATLEKISRFLGRVMAEAPPDIEHSSRQDLWTLLNLGRRLRGLGKEDAYRLLRWGPMPVADFAAEWFESEPLRAAIAARGIFGTSLGPRSAGSTAVLLMQMAVGSPVMVRGGLGALTSALAAAAKAAGAEIQTGAEVHRINVVDGRVHAVTLVSGEQIPASVVVSNADPRRTFLGLLDPIDLEPGFVGRVRGYRSTGNVVKINLALDGLPTFGALKTGDSRLLRGRIHIGPTLEYLERAFDASKYGACSDRPYLDVTIPSLADSSLAPPGKHVMSICAQFAPYTLRDRDWSETAGTFADAAIDTLAEHAPDIRTLILSRQVITPRELETTYGLTGGHIFHGELALDQLFTMRPLLGWAQYRTPVQGLFLCSAGTHPGYGVSGLSGLNAARAVLRTL